MIIQEDFAARFRANPSQNRTPSNPINKPNNHHQQQQHQPHQPYQAYQHQSHPPTGDANNKRKTAEANQPPPLKRKRVEVLFSSIHY